MTPGGKAVTQKDMHSCACGYSLYGWLKSTNPEVKEKINDQRRCEALASTQKHKQVPISPACTVQDELGMRMVSEAVLSSIPSLPHKSYIDHRIMKKEILKVNFDTQVKETITVILHTLKLTL